MPNALELLDVINTGALHMDATLQKTANEYSQIVTGHVEAIIDTLTGEIAEGEKSLTTLREYIAGHNAHMAANFGALADHMNKIKAEHNESMVFILNSVEDAIYYRNEILRKLVAAPTPAGPAPMAPRPAIMAGVVPMAPRQ